MHAPASRRIGVLTFHRCINYGSYWQARQLVDGVRAMGHEVELLDHESARVTWAERRCAFQPTLPARATRADMRRYGAKTRRFENAFATLPLSDPFPLDDPNTADCYRAVIVGSDEVWNLSHPWYGGEPIFYGDGLAADRLVSYAASFGNTDADAGLDPAWGERLCAFDSLSVRDENSRALVRNATGRDPALVLDPVLQFPPEVEAADEPPFVALYGHNFPDWFAGAVRAWADRRELKLLSIGYRNDWADAHRIEAGPIEFASLIAGAAAVVTNFFHGCVFSLVNAKPFACVASSYRSNKVRDLTAALGAERHLIGEGEALGDVLDAPLAPEIGRRIDALRAQSSAYLAAALA
jgi:hypothetical protein